MEICVCNFDILHGDINRQVGVQCIKQVLEAVMPLEVKCRHLSRGVNTGVGASGQSHRASRPAKFAQSLFEFALHGPMFCLPLTSSECCAVISKDQFVTCHV